MEESEAQWFSTLQGSMYGVLVRESVLWCCGWLHHLSPSSHSSSLPLHDLITDASDDFTFQRLESQGKTSPPVSLAVFAAPLWSARPCLRDAATFSMRGPGCDQPKDL